MAHSCPDCYVTCYCGDERLAGRVVVASVSGGKDSAAMCLWLAEQGIEHRRVFADTGWEHPLTYEYIRGPLTEKLGPIDEVRGPWTFETLVRQKVMFPSRRKFRFCSSELKVEPIKAYFAQLPDDRDYINAVGIRRAESLKRANATEWEWQPDFDCWLWRPLVEWTVQDVIAIHRRHRLVMNPLYAMGASRVGCWPCINANKRELRLVAETDPGRIDRIRRLEAQAQAGSRSKPTMFTLRPNGVKHVRKGIDEVIEWAKSDAPEPPTMFDDGCMRWGMCETAPPDGDDD